MRPDGGGLPLGWPTIYRAGPGYLLGVPQMLHPEPKKKGFHAFLAGVDDCRMMTNP